MKSLVNPAKTRACSPNFTRLGENDASPVLADCHVIIIRNTMAVESLSNNENGRSTQKQHCLRQDIGTDTLLIAPSILGVYGANQLFWQSSSSSRLNKSLTYCSVVLEPRCARDRKDGFENRARQPIITEEGLAVLDAHWLGCLHMAIPASLPW